MDQQEKDDLAAELSNDGGLTELQQLQQENELVKQSLADVRAELERTKQELEGTLAINAELTKQIEEGIPATEESKSNASSKKFEVEGEVYGFKKHAVHFKNRVITADDVLEDEALQQHLVKIKSGMIYKIESQPEA
jgi:hypothetical protein